MHDRTADLVLEGGGVKGIGLVGAIARLQDSGYVFNRISGTSAGAVVGALVAAGLSGQELRDTALSLDYRKFRDPGPIDRVPVLGPSVALLRNNGFYQGDYVRQWLLATLSKLGVRTFADLRLDDPALPPEQRYKLVVTVSDVTRGLLIRLPWDYRSCFGIDPDDQLVADAVRASMSIPFFFEPVVLQNPITKKPSTLVDGGLLSNFPINALDRTDGKAPRWPTFGIKLLPNFPADHQLFQLLGLPLLDLPSFGPLRLLEEVIATAVCGNDQAALYKPSAAVRAITVDTDSVGLVDFNISRERQMKLYNNGYSAANSFLGTWNWPAYLREFRLEATEPVPV